MTTLAQPKNVLLSNVTLNWARLDTPVDNPFGGAPSWEVQAASADKSVFAEMEALGAKVKEADGLFTVSLRRKSERADGSTMDPVRVVDGQKNPMDSTARRKIGNGSKGNIIVWCAPYEYMKRKGVTFSLTAVQVTELEEYTGGTGGVDFDIVGDSSSPSSESADLF